VLTFFPAWHNLKGKTAELNAMDFFLPRFEEAQNMHMKSYHFLCVLPLKVFCAAKSEREQRC